MRFAALCGLCCFFAWPPGSWAAGPEVIVAQAERRDFEGRAHLAFMLYRRAAEAGLPDAEFNVAIMLDSGRGVIANAAEAATWYARAATHGNRRAAYNLGQLYAAGEGVPKNEGLARAWYSASGLPAARAYLARPRLSETAPSSLTPPILIEPAADIHLQAALGGVELIWTSRPQPEPVSYRVDLRAVDDVAHHSATSASVMVTGLFATLPSSIGRYAWRVGHRWTSERPGCSEQLALLRC